MFADINKLNRIQKQIQSDLSPKFTEMKTGVRTSRFGRPQVEAQQDINSIPTEVAKFVSKHSPKRLKPKETNLEECHGEETKKLQTQEVQNIPLEDKENFEENESSGIQETVIMSVKEQEETSKMFKEEEQVTMEQKVPETSENREASLEKDDEVTHKSPSDEGKQDFSDTDSALGSASSCHDIKNNNNSDFIAGQLLWASFSKLSWFPCMAYPIDNEGNVISGEFKRLRCSFQLIFTQSFLSR